LAPTRLHWLLLICLVLLIPTRGTADDQAPDSRIELRTPHFTVISNASEKDATEIAEHFEKIRAALPEFFPLPVPRIDPAQPVLILAMKDEESLAKLLPEYWSEAGRTRPGGIFYRAFDGNFIVCARTPRVGFDITWFTTSTRIWRPTGICRFFPCG